MLKVWPNYTHVPGVTTPFDDDSQPMAGTGSPAVIISSRGGIYNPGTHRRLGPRGSAAAEVLQDALGMDVSVIPVSRTPSDVVPDLAAEAGRAAEELRAAHGRAAELARSLRTAAAPGGVDPARPDLA